MNSLIILVSICAFFVAGVRSSHRYRPHFCDNIEDEEAAETLLNCVGDNFPEALLNLVAKCYRQEFGDSEGTWGDLVLGLCDETELNQEQLEKYRNCLNEGEGGALSDAGVTAEEARRGEEAGKQCISEKLGRRRRDVSSLGLA